MSSIIPEAWNIQACRSGKSTHISMISNSVTHLRSYTNTAIAENAAPISSVTPRDRRRLRNERRYRRIEWPPRVRRHRRAKRRRLHIECRRLHIERRRLRIERRYCRIEWRVFECFMMFHNVLRVFHDVLLVVHDVLLVVHNVLLVVQYVLWCLVSRATLASPHRRLRGRRSPQGSRQRRRSLRKLSSRNRVTPVCIQDGV